MTNKKHKTPGTLYRELSHLPFEERWKEFHKRAQEECGLTECEDEDHKITKEIKKIAKKFGDLKWTTNQ